MLKKKKKRYREGEGEKGEGEERYADAVLKMGIRRVSEEGGKEESVMGAQC